MKPIQAFHLQGIIVFIVLITGAAAWAGPAKGPLQVRNQFPPHLMFLTPKPDGPDLPAQNQFNIGVALDYSSAFVNEVAGPRVSIIDMEMTTLELSFAYGLFDRLSLGLDLPLVSMNGGFLDDFLKDFHDTFSFPNYGRGNRPDNEFLYVIRTENRDWFDSDAGGIHLADSVLTAKLRLAGATASPFAVSLAYSLKLPTGDEENGFGSGNFDHGIFLLSRFQWGQAAFYVNPGYIFLSDPDLPGPPVSAENIFSLLIGGEYVVNDKWSLLVQGNFYSSPISDTNIPHLDDDALELELGLIYRVRPWIDFEFAFCEDLSGAVPDFNVHGAFRFRFGP